MVKSKKIKSVVLLSLGLVAFFMAGCGVRPVRSLASRGGGAQTQLNPAALAASVFEIVVDNVLLDDNIVYQKQPDLSNLPYSIRSKKHIGVGTAFVVSPGEFVSAAHVLAYYGENAPAYYIRDSRTGAIYKIGEITRFDSPRDVVTFKLEGAGPQTVPLKIVRQSRVGDTVYTVGNALGEGIAVRSGNIASYTPEPETGKWKHIRFTSPASPGNSGGPLLTSGGHVLGIVLAKSSSENLNYAVPWSEYSNLSTALSRVEEKLNLRSGHVKEPVLWRYERQLPVSLQKFYIEATNHRDNFLVKSFDLLHKNNSSKIFPTGIGLEKFRRVDPVVMPSIYYVQADQAGHFEASKIEGKNVQFSGKNYSKSGLLYNLGTDSFIVHANIEDPQKYVSIIGDSYALNRIVLEGVSVRHKIDSSEYFVTGFKKASQDFWRRDSWGRNWHVAVFNDKITRTKFLQACLPDVGGVACLVTYAEASESSLRFDNDVIGDITAGIMFSYQGSLQNWKSFESLPADQRPDLLKNLKVRFMAGRLDVSSDDFLLNFSDKNISGQSLLSLHVGLRGDNVIGFRTRSLVLIPDSGTPGVSFLSMYKVPPQSGAEPAQMAQWKAIVQRQGNFNGTPYSTEGVWTTARTRGLSHGARAPASTIGLTTPLVLDFCSVVQSQGATSASQKCNGFQQSLRWLR